MTRATVSGVSVPTQILLAGKGVDSSDEATFDVHDPATEEVIATIADGTVDDGVRALD